MTRAFVLAGGGSLGAAQVGMLESLLEAGIVPELVVGTSAGALNGAMLVGDPTPEGVRGLAALWTGLRRSSVFPTSPFGALRGLLGRAPSLCSPAGLSRVIEGAIKFDRLENAPLPFVVVATDLRDGSEVLLEAGPAPAALLASAAIPGILPPVVIDEQLLVDGAISHNAPISAAIARGATEVWVLPGGFACAGAGGVGPDAGALAVGLHALTLLVGQRLRQDLTRDHGVPVHLVPPLCPVAVAPHDFSQAAVLIERARTGTRQWLESDPTGSAALAMLGPHAHR